MAPASRPSTTTLPTRQDDASPTMRSPHHTFTTPVSTPQSDPYRDVQTLLQPQSRVRCCHGLASFTSICLRSFGQCCLQNSPFTGLVFLIALATTANGPCMASLALLGCVSSNLFALVMGFDQGVLAAGLFGYNATLVGCAFQAFVVGDASWIWAAHGYILLAVPCLSMFSVLVGSAAANVLPPGTPALTIAFQLTVWCWLLATHNWSPSVGAAFAPSPGLYLLPQEDAPLFPSYDVAKVCVAVASGLAQCCLASEWYVGCAFVVGIALCSPISAVYAVIGSALGTGMAVAVGASPDHVYLGLYGFNGALCSIALGGFFLLAKGLQAHFLVVLGIGGSTMLMSSTMASFAPLGLPALTWPFTLMTWLILVSAKSMKGVVVIPLEELQTPEAHFKQHKQPRDTATQPWNHVDQTLE